MKRCTAALLALVLVTACSLVPGDVPADPGGGLLVGDPPNLAAAMRPDLLVIDPATAAPGEVVALTFPEETARGVLFVLEVQDGEAWRPVAYLTSDGPGAGWEREWWSVDAEGFAVPDIGVAGPGPDRVVVPEVAQPGQYRICTGNAGSDFCAPLEIAAP